jgi:hypothetical protein
LIPPALPFLLKIDLAFWGLSCFYMKQCLFLIFVMSVIRILMGIVLNMEIAFGNTSIFTILICQTMRMGDLSISIVFFNFFVQWYILFILEFFHHHYEVYSYVLFNLFFDSIVNGNVFYILSHSVHCWYTELLVMFLKLFCILLLCWRYLWTLEFLWQSFPGLLDIRSHYLQIGTVWLLFLFEFCLFLLPVLLLWIGIQRLCWVRLDSGYSCLIPDCRGNGSSFSTFKMMLAFGFS